MSEAAYAVEPEVYVEPERYEIIEGVKYFMAAAAANGHNFLSGRLFSLFDRYFDEHGTGVVLQDVDIEIDEDNTFRPDVSVIVSRLAYFKWWEKFKGVPDLTVEILSRSTGNNDRGKKMEVYARNGVKEYWIVDGRNMSIEVYHLIDGRYMLDGLYQLPSDKELEQMDEAELKTIKYEIKVSVVPDLVINVKDVFKFKRNPLIKE